MCSLSPSHAAHGPHTCLPCLHASQAIYPNTLRDIPKSADLRLREAAERERISLNKAAVQALNRGLGLETGCVRYRVLGALVRKHKGIERQGWAEVLHEMDKVNKADWA